MLYAWRFQDKAKRYVPSGKTMSDLKLLFTYRERLIRMKIALGVSAKEIRQVMKRDATARFMYEDSREEVIRLNKKILKIEKMMKLKISEDQDVQQNYDLTTSVKGIGMVNAIAFIVTTDNFTRFESVRQ